MQENFRLVYLYDRVINNKASLKEAEEFWTRLKEAGQDDPVWKEVYNAYHAEDSSVKEPSWEIAETRLFAPRKSRRYYRLKWAAAASVLVLIASALFLSIKTWNVSGDNIA